MGCKISWDKFAQETFALKSKTTGPEPGQLCYHSSFTPVPVSARGYRLWRYKTRFIALVWFPLGWHMEWSCQASQQAVSSLLWLEGGLLIHHALSFGKRHQQCQNKGKRLQVTSSLREGCLRYPSLQAVRETGHGKVPTQLHVIISCSQAEVQVKVAQVLKSRLKSMDVKRQKRSKVRSGCVARCGDAGGKANCEKLWVTNYSFEITHIKNQKNFCTWFIKRNCIFW